MHQFFHKTTLFRGKSCLFPISKSFASWAGVIFTAHVQKSISTISSAIIGISLFTIGSISFFHAFNNFLYLLSFGCTATATSHRIVSGLVVTTVISLSDQETK
jgi:hypothetical protein